MGSALARQARVRAWRPPGLRPGSRAIHLLNDILTPPLGTAPAVGAPDPVCVLLSGRAWFEHMIRDRRDCGLSLDGYRMPKWVATRLRNYCSPHAAAVREFRRFVCFRLS